MELDEQSFRRLDDAATVKFLSSMAGVFAENQLLSAHEADDLRVHFSSLSLGQTQGKSVLAQLDEDNAEFLALLRSHFGSVGLVLNLWRVSSRQTLAEVTASLSEFGEEVLKKSKVFFNRPFLVFLHSRCEQTTLFSSILTEFSASLDRACEGFADCRKQLDSLYCQRLDLDGQVDGKIDETIATQLSLSQCSFETLPFRLEQTAKWQTFAHWNSLIYAAQELTEQLRHNLSDDRTAKLTVLVDTAQADAQMLCNFTFPRSPDIDIWERRRIQYLRTQLKLAHTMNQFGSLLLHEILQIGLLQESRRSLAGQDVIRGLTSTLIKSGTPPLKAQEAASALARFCEQEDVTPKDLIPGELARINPHLSIKSLETLKRLESDDFMAISSQTKQDNLKQQSQLLKRFHDRLSRIGLLILPFLILGGCGVKLAPKSKLIDYRPPVNYHSSERPTTETFERKKEDKDDKK